MDTALLAEAFEGLRGELTAYLRRLVVRADVAEDLAQTAALRALQAGDRTPGRPEELRPWIFRIATHLGVDELRRRGRRRETYLAEAKAAAERHPTFVPRAMEGRGSPEMRHVAREHLAICFGCTLGQLPPEQAAALLLKEVYGFTVEETAGILDAGFGQVKNWLQASRAAMRDKYAATCSLISKQGVCYQCVELDEAFRAGQGNPLAETRQDVEARLAILRETKARPAGRWERLLLEIFDELG